MNFEKLDQLKLKLDSFRQLPVEIVRELHEDLVLRWTHNSCAIEGNTLTLNETKVALEGITVGGKTMREHLEVLNHREAILYVEELVRQKEVLSEWQIKSLHQLVFKKIDNSNAGKYRTVNVVLVGVTHRPPDHLRLTEEMAGFIDWYKTEGRNLHPIERAALVHADFAKIRPFADVNGRTSRLLMNLELMKSGFPPAVLPVEKRLVYYEALDTAHTCGDYGPFLALMFEIVEQSFEPYRFALGERESRK